MTRYPLRRGTAAPVMVEYTDAEGDRSLRKVMPLGVIIGDGPRTPDRIYLHAKCSVAKAVRSFRLDRIQGIIDPETGEAERPSDWIAARHLGDGRAFAWSDDEHGSDVESQDVASTAVSAPRPRWVLWRLAFYSVAIGYLIGRFRVLHVLLHLAGVHRALWL